MNSALLQPTRHDVYPFIDPRKDLQGAASGKRIVVTGAGAGGIGEGIAEAFALARAAELILVGRRVEPLETTKARLGEVAPKCKVTIVGETDIASLESVEKLFAGLPTVPDVVVSNAGVSGAVASVADADPEKWSNFDINVRGSYNVARTYVRAFRSATGSRKPESGILINVSSNAAWRYYPGLSSYGGSKIALTSMSEYVDREEAAEGGSGVRCVAMHPGGVKTTLGGFLPEDLQKRILIDTPQLPGGTAVYLTTERARFLMGRFVSSTWDMEEVEKYRKKIEQEDLLKSRIVGVA